MTWAAEFRELLESRLRTVDYRHSDKPDKERERIRGEVKRMLGNIDKPKESEDDYRGEF